MQTVSIRELQHHLSEMIKKVGHGQEIRISHRNRIIARLIPDRQQTKPVQWPDFATRARQNLRPKGKPLTSLLAEEREERC